jgi:hydroxymethylpyrimidine pyrophosphatase-like HAD family hydrolase
MTRPAPGPDLQWLVACDLDQTLIYSRRAFRLPAGEPEPDVVVVEYLDGDPLSHLTCRAAQGLRELAARVPIVPVTTRTLAQYERVSLGFTPAYAIAANGGHLLVDGRLDRGWAEQVRERLAGAGRPLAEVHARALAIADQSAADGSGWVRTVREADGFFVYLVAAERESIPDLTALEDELADDGWSLSVQGRKVYLVPAALTKEAALAEVMRRTGAGRLAAAGDSLLDLGMLSMADVAIRPAHGELHEQGIIFPFGAGAALAAAENVARLLVTALPGVLAGEEIIGLLRNAIAADEILVTQR